MPDLRNEMPEPDHDILVEMRAELRQVVKEIDNLREWRHDVAAPAMMAIQAQQKANADHIGRLATSVEKFTVSVAALATVPADFRDHLIADRESFEKVGTAIGDLFEKIERNRDERAKGETKLMLWVAGIVGFALLGVIAAMWALLSPHLPLH